MPYIYPQPLNKLLLKINSEYTIVTPHKVDPRKATVFFNELLEGNALYYRRTLRHFAHSC